MIHLLKRGLEREEEQLLGPRVVVAISDVEGDLVAIATQPESDKVWPSDDDDAVREEREA